MRVSLLIEGWDGTARRPSVIRDVITVDTGELFCVLPRVLPTGDEYVQIVVVHETGREARSGRVSPGFGASAGLVQRVLHEARVVGPVLERKQRIVEDLDCEELVEVQAAGCESSSLLFTTVNAEDCLVENVTLVRGEKEFL